MEINELCINCFNPTGGEEVCMHCGHIQTDKPRQLCHLYPHTVLNGRYIIGNDINNGGFGVVYKAYDAKLETIVAIKELLPTQNSIVNRVPGTTDVIPVGEKRAEQFAFLKQKFLEEARLMAQFSQNEGIVHIYDFFEANNTAYHVMEYLEGENLREFLNKNDNKMDFETASKIMLPIMDILKDAHKNNVIHCDVSPDNIFLCNNGKVKLIDFGAAKFSETETNTDDSASIVAKPGYTPPEQYRKKGKIGPYTDIYSVGAVLYRLLSGQIPEESIDRAEKDDLQKLSKLGVEVPLFAEKSIMKALALRENARFKSMGDFIDALKGEKKADFPEEELKKRKIIRAVSIAAAFIVMVSSVVATYFIKNYNSLVPSKSEQITMWYKDTGDEGLNERWSNIEKYFADFAAAQNKRLDGTSVEIVGIPADEYKETLEAAFEDGKAPDIYEASDEDFDKYAFSLDNVYGELKESDFENAFTVMKKLYADENKIAVCFDTPVLFTYTDFNYISEPSKETSLDDLIGADSSSGKFKYSLLCNPDALLYSAYAYGYDGDDKTDIVEKLFNASHNFKGNDYISPDSVFASTKNNTMYYIGMMSEFSTISKESRAGQASFSVSHLTGADIMNYYVFPEVFSISEQSSNSKRQTAALLLYYLASTADGQSDITKSNKNTYYLPMYTEAVNEIGYSDKYSAVYFSDNKDITLSLNEYNEISDKADEISEKVREKKTSFKGIEKILNSEE